MQKSIICKELITESDPDNNDLRRIVLRSFLKSREPSPNSSRSISLSPRFRKPKQEFVDNVEKMINLFLEGKEFRSQGDTINYVFPIQHDNVIFGYLKVGKDGEEGASSMETLMYYLSIYFSVSDYFTETNVIKMTPRKIKRLSVSSQNNNGDIQIDRLNNIISKDMVNASFQNALRGKSLKQYISEGISLNFIIKDSEKRNKQFILGFFYTIAFGMFDVNSGNIIFENEQLKFFDNTRSLAHSVEFIKWGTSIVLAFRSSLFELVESFDILDKDMIDILEKEIVKFERRLTRLDKFFLRSDINALIVQLPKGWFYPDLVISAMNNRLKRMKNGIRYGKIKTCEDLVHITFPHYRFFSILFVLTEYLSNKPVISKILSMKPEDDRNLEKSDYIEFWRRGLVYASTGDIVENLQKCYFLGVNPKELLTECLQESFDYRKTMKNLYTKIRFIIELDYLDSNLENIEKLNTSVNESIDNIPNILVLFKVAIESAQEILKGIREIESVKTLLHSVFRIIKHKTLLESIHEELVEIYSKTNNYNKDDKSEIRDIIYRFHYISELRKFISEIGNDLLNNMISENDEGDLYFIIKYLNDQTEPDFKDIPNETIIQLVTIDLEIEFDRENIKYTKTFPYIMTDYMIEITNSDKVGQTQYILKYKKIKWKHEKIFSLYLDIYSSPGFVKLIGKKNIDPMTIPHFVTWLPSFIAKK